MFGLGIDLVEIDRIKKSLNNPKFIKNIFSKTEYEQLKEKNFSANSIAANFCAKEAFLKSIGKGLGTFKLNQIELLRKKNGMPYINLNEQTLKFSKENNLEFLVSISHTQQYACAVVLAEKK